MTETQTGYVPGTTSGDGSYDAYAVGRSQESRAQERLAVAADAALTALIRLDHLTSALVTLGRLCTVEELAEMAETAANQLLRRNTAVQQALLAVVTAAKTERGAQ